MQTSSSHNCYPRPRESQQSASLSSVLTTSHQPHLSLTLGISTHFEYKLNSILLSLSWMKWPIGRDSIQSLCSDDQIYWGPRLTMQCMAPQISGHSLTYPGQWARDSDRVQGLPVWHHCEHNMRAVMWAALQESGEGTWINWSPSYSLISSH